MTRSLSTLFLTIFVLALAKTVFLSSFASAQGFIYVSIFEDGQCQDVIVPNIPILALEVNGACISYPGLPFSASTLCNATQFIYNIWEGVSNCPTTMPATMGIVSVGGKEGSCSQISFAENGQNGTMWGIYNCSAASANGEHYGQQRLPTPETLAKSTEAVHVVHELLNREDGRKSSDDVAAPSPAVHEARTPQPSWRRRGDRRGRKW